MKKYKQLKADIILDFYLDEICKFRKVEKSEVLKKSRKREYEDIRHIAIFLAKKQEPKMKLKDISDFFGLKEHSTIVHCLTKIENLKGSDADIRRTLEYCEKLDFVPAILESNGFVDQNVFYVKSSDECLLQIELVNKDEKCDFTFFGRSRESDFEDMIYYRKLYEIQSIDIFDVIIISKNINSNPLGVLINSLKN